MKDEKAAAELAGESQEECEEDHADFEHVKAVFEEYLNGYDRENDKVKLKIVHTYGVIRAVRRSDGGWGFRQKIWNLVKLIALLHDIGRFEQLKRFNSFEADTMDHATYGVKVLFEEE